MERFWSKVKKGAHDECWMWQASKNVWGYGAFTLGGKSVNASRAAYILTHGEVGDGLVVCHRCDVPACCNPAHLFVATQAENLRDCREKGRQVYRYGKDHHRATAKLTPEMVAEARKMYFEEGVSQTEIGRIFGVHSSVICRAVNGKSWGHL